MTIVSALIFYYLILLSSDQKHMHIEEFSKTPINKLLLNLESPETTEQFYADVPWEYKNCKADTT